MVDVHQTIGILPLKDSDLSCASDGRDTTGVRDEVDSGRGFAGNDVQDTGHGGGRIDTVAYAESLKSEECRRQTFQNANWPSFDNWPVGHRVTPYRLAAAGLYYTGHSDVVRCAFCRKTLSQWAPTDDPWSEHNRLYPECIFKGGSTAGNVPAQQNLPPQPRAASGAGSQPLHHELRDARARLATFGRLSAAAQRNFPQIESVAEAGFYLIDGAGDSTVCFWCGGTLRCWSSGENPWMEHARWFPECEFVKKVKGADFVLGVQLLFSDAQQPRGAYHSASEMAQGQEPAPAYDIAPGEERLAQISPLHVSPSLEARTAFELLSGMGITREQIQAIARQQQHVGNVESTSREEPSGAVFTLNPNQLGAARSRSSEASSPSLPSVTEQGNVVSQASDPEYVESMEIEQPGPSEGAGALICRLCLSEERQRAFVPCGHFVACENCALDALRCPACSCNVRGTYRVYVP